jgi:hypothetical protein
MRLIRGRTRPSDLSLAPDPRAKIQRMSRKVRAPASGRVKRAVARLARLRTASAEEWSGTSKEPTSAARALPTYCFRVGFRLGRRVRIQSDGHELVLRQNGDEHVSIRAGGDDDTPLKDAEQVSLRGGRYATEDSAREAGERWVFRLQAAFARLRIGADFGLRSPRGMITPHGLKWFESMTGRRMLASAPGVLVFECDPEPRFVRVGPFSAVVGKPGERLVHLVNVAAHRGVVLSERDRLAFDLYSASFSETSADARFMLLMMPAETLIEQNDRPDDVRAHVERLIEDTRNSQLASDEIESLVGSLEWLKVESVGQAGRRLAATLGDRKYMDESPSTFFTHCYVTRSQLVHGRFPRPAAGAVGTRAANLEGFVGDLLGAALLDVEIG